LGALKMEHSATDEWAAEFDDWIYDQLQAKALPNLLDYRRRQRYAELAHPSDEHLVPLFVAMGAGQSDGEFERIHHSFSKGNISMTAYAFGTPDQLNAFAE
jgi:4,5-DOPA dioxygenase extradiol